MKSAHHITSLEPEMLTEMYLAFLDSFSDYSVPFKLTKAQFVQKFVQRLKISFELSCGVYRNGGGLAAFIFTAVNEYKGINTAYNGGTGVRPNHRGQRLVSLMYDYLFPIFQKQHIKQCILEVLTTNEKAIRAYKSVGFEKSDLFRCYKLVNAINFSTSAFAEYVNVPEPRWSVYADFADFAPSFLDSQNMIALNAQNIMTIEAQRDGDCLGYIIYQPTFGRINQIGIHPQHRGRGIGKSLVKKMIENSRKDTFTVLNISERNPGLHYFFQKLGFVNELNQFEMAISLSA